MTDRVPHCFFIFFFRQQHYTVWYSLLTKPSLTRSLVQMMDGGLTYCAELKLHVTSQLRNTGIRSHDFLGFGNDFQILFDHSIAREIRG